MAIDNDNELEVAEDTAFQEEDTVQVGETADEPANEVEIPDELAGIDESTAREIMAEAGIETGQEEEPPAEDNSVNKHEDVLPNQRIPYKRFKQQVDRTHELEAQIEQLKKQMANTANANTDQQNSTVVPNQMRTINVPTAETQPMINAEVTKQLNEVILQETMKITGMSKDDVEALEYMDDDDTRKQTWNTAKRFAEQSIYAKVQDARNRQLAESRRVIAAQNENVLRFNAFAEEQMQDKNFQQIQDFAINDFFSAQDKGDQSVIAAAYARIQNDAGSPSDTMIIKKYFIDAKNEFYKRHGGNNAATTKKQNNTSNKIRQGQSFPRSGGIEGAGSEPGAVTAETLEQMLETMPFNEIPKEYQNILLGIQ